MSAAARPATLPPAGVGEQPARIGIPVAWDPCRVIHYVTSGAAPAGMTGLVVSALREVTRLTGFRFVNDGATTEQPDANRSGYQPDRYGTRWAPVLIAWTNPHVVRGLARNTIGIGGGFAIKGNGAADTYVSGLVYLDKPEFISTLTSARRHDRTRGVLRAVVLHELGHLLGLAHVTDRTSIMFPETHMAVTDYSAGDRRGLHALSEGSCAPNL